MNKIIEFLFGFKECKKCLNKNKCNKKPWLHIEKECNYNVVNKR